MVPDTYPDLFWSYTVVWVVLGVYLVLLGARVAKLERSLSRQSSSSHAQDEHEPAAVCNSQR
jgi:CcmD family protein